MSIFVVAGARPQFVKAAALMAALPDARLVHTGQHADASMVEAHFDGLDLAPPDFRLPSTATDRAARCDEMTAELVRLIERERPARILALGDTDSTRAAAIAGSMTGTSVGHVEAGARSGEPDLPEESNRIVVDAMSDLLFCATPRHAANLAGRDGVHVVGDVMADVFLRHEATIRERAPSDGPYAVLTLHRAATADDPARVDAVLEAVAGAVGMPVRFVRHPRLARDHARPDGLEVQEPLPYVDFLALVAGAAVVATDSGGLQKEAYLLGVPCVTLRDRTEWMETVDAGWNVLAGTDTGRITAALADLPRAADRPPHYGDGRAAQRIAELV